MKNLDTMNYKDAKDLFDSLNEEVNKIRLISNPTNFQNDPAFSKLIHLREEVRKLLEIVPAHRVKTKVVTIPTLNASGKINESEEVVETHEPPQESEIKQGTSTNQDKKKIRFTHAVPKFVGRELEVYGPFESSEIIELPLELAKILIDKGRAEEVN